MPFVKIEMFAGRTTEQKAALVASVTAAVSQSIACPPEAVWISISENSKENWGSGGHLASAKSP
ncbi:MAG: 2-hydroxymuconate tautomerase, partial [Albidovulum sp.]